MGKPKQISCFDKRGKVTPEFSDILDIAQTIQIAIYLTPRKPIKVVIMETAKRMSKAPQNRSEWRQNILKRYAQGTDDIVEAHFSTMDGYWDFVSKGVKLFRKSR